MNFRTTLVGAAALLAALAPTSSAQLEGYELTSGVPSDFFLVVGSRKTAETQFIDNYWKNVEDAFWETEVVDELFDMLAAEDEAAAGMVSSTFDYYSKLFSDVNWSAMGDQMIFAERLNVPVFSGNTASIGAPDMIWLMRMPDETAKQNYAGILALGQGLLAQINGMAGTELAFETVNEKGFTLSVLDFTQLGQDAPDFPISFGYKDGVMVATMGSGVRGEVVTLLSGEGEIRSIASTPRFQKAFQGMPKAETSFEYFDMPNMRGSIEDIFEMVTSMLEAELGPAPDFSNMEEPVEVSEEQMMTGVIMQIMDLAYEGMSLIESTSSVSFVEGYSVHTISRSSMAANIESNRFFPLIGTVKPVEDFARYLPKETTGYSVTGATDANAMYDFALGLLADFGPMGEIALAEWAILQEDMGFDVRRDLISWMGGETISVDFQLDGKDAWVWRMQVGDEEAAREKLNMAAGMVPMIMSEMAKENPMANILGLVVRDSRDERYEGFKRVDISIAGVSMLAGVKDGWLLLGSSGDALALTDEVAAGLAPNVRQNELLMGQAILPEGPVHAVSFNNYAGMTDGLATGLMFMTSMGGMFTSNIPNDDEREIANKLIGMLGRLVPVLAEIDFFESGSMVSSFDGQAWHTHSVTNYRKPRKSEMGEL